MMEEYAEEESPLTEPKNLPRDPIPEDLTTNSLELLQTVKDLKTKMESVKQDNERILRAQEELNQILIEKFQTRVGVEESNQKILVINVNLKG